MRRHPRAQRLQVVLDLTERQEQDALREWGTLQQQLLQEQNQRQQLEVYTLEYQQQISAPRDTPVTAGSVHNALGFMGQIEAALKSQSQKIRQVQDKTDKARESYLVLRGKVKALTDLIDKLEQEFMLQDEKNAQKQADEWANRAAFRSRSARHSS